jgi:hypothetical protein
MWSLFATGICLSILAEMRHTFSPYMRDYCQSGLPRSFPGRRFDTREEKKES